MNGYMGHFRLKKLPFSTSPDPEFAFATRAHEIELLRMQDAVQQRLGLCLLKGDIGTGKSTIAHMLMQSWAADPSYHAVYISDPSPYTPAQFLRSLTGAFGLTPARNAQANMDNLKGFLIDQYAANKTVVALLDESQLISAPNMTTLLHLTNLTLPKSKLLQIALLALPSFDRKLSYQKALDSRIARRGTLSPLIFEDAIALIQYRLKIAGANFSALFPVTLHRLIYNATSGIPRRICVLCDNILFEAYARGEKVVSETSVEAAIKNCEFTGGNK